VRKEGKRIWYEIDDPLLLESVTSLHYEGMNTAAMKALRWFKRAFTLGVTVNPEFMLANLIRDTIHSMAVSELSVKTGGLANALGGLKSFYFDKELRAHLMAGGGEIHFGHLFSGDPEAARKLIKRREVHMTDILHNTSALSRLKRAVPRTWDAWRELGSGFENANRAALYKQLRAKKWSHFDASFAARDLMDFSQHGSWKAARFLAQAVPFINARIQGLDKAYRASRTQPLKLAAVVGAVMVAGALLYLHYRDDDDFKEREDWDRDMYYWVKVGDTAYRIPKPFEVGVAGTLFERAIEQMVDDDRVPADFLNSLKHAFLETLAFNPLPQAINPTIELIADKSFFTGRHIEGPGMRLHRSAQERRRHYTPELATYASRGMSRVLPEGAVLSPVQLEHLVRGYFGWAGITALDILSRGTTLTMEHVAGVDLPAKPGWRPEDYPALGRFVRGQPARTTRYTREFYDALKEVRAIQGDIRLMKRQGEIERMVKTKARHGRKLRHRRYLEQQAKKLSQANEQMMKIRLNQTMTPEMKRRKIDDLLARKNRITERAFERTRISFQ
jgi:hypothetical protein